MTDERKTVYVNDKPISIFLWAEVQHCVNAYDSDLYLKVRKGEAEIHDEKGDRIGWGGFAGDGQHIYVRLLNGETPQADDRKTVYVNDEPISIFLRAAVQHCVNAYDRDLYRKVRKGEAGIFDELGGHIGWGSFASDGQHIYVRLTKKDNI